MSNMGIDASLSDGGLTHYHKKGQNCKTAVETLIGHDFGAPPFSLTFTVHTKSGKLVNLMIPYNLEGVASVYIDGEIV